MRTVVLFLVISFFLLSCRSSMADDGHLQSLENVSSHTIKLSSQMTGEYHVQLVAMSRPSCPNEHEVLTPGIYVCAKKNSPEKKYILSEPGIANTAHLCEIDLRFGKKQESMRAKADWNAKHEFCYCKRILFGELLKSIDEEGYSCHKDTEEGIIPVDVEFIES